MKVVYAHQKNEIAEVESLDDAISFITQSEIEDLEDDEIEPSGIYGVEYNGEVYPLGLTLKAGADEDSLSEEDYTLNLDQVEALRSAGAQ